MRTRIRILALFGFIGVIHVVLIAWACAVLSEKPVFRMRDILDPSARWPMPVPEDWPDTPHAVFSGESRGYSIRGAQRHPRREIPDAPGRFRLLKEHRIEIHEFGWPVPALQAVRLYALGTTTDRNAIAMPTLLDPVARGSRRVLPLRPIWPGFAIGVILFGVVGWMLLEGPRQFRRGVRAWKGRCPVCGYDLRGTTGDCCPECGHVK